ncbi:MAG: XkdF-like putative serine protease domain-containing protein [Candidatus Nanopelagicales bacterium]
MIKKEEKKVVELEVIEDMEDSGVSAIALVDEPAIEKFWVYLKKEAFVKPKSGEREADYIPRCMSVLVGDEGYDQDQAAAICYSTWREEHSKEMEFESYTDYPESASNAAKRVLEWAEKNGWGDCLTPVGKARANQLANREPISEETIARMASFARHLQYKDVPYSEGCGGIGVDAWGGQAGIEWAQNKLESIREKMSIDTSSLPPYVDETVKKKRKFNEYGCPASTVDIELNLKNRQEAIDAANYGPLNPGEPNEEYWQAKADKFNTSVEDAKSAKCGNCGFFVRTKEMLACIAAGIGEEPMADPYDAIQAGELGYCEAFDFKCAADRTCDAWIAGGPILEEKFIEPNPCWEGYEAYGTKILDGKEVPNCVPIENKKLAFALEKDQQIVVGPVAIPDIEIYRKDDNGETYYVKFSEATIQKMQEKFMKELRNLDTNIEHNEYKNANAYVFESWIVEDPKTDKANTVYNLALPKGAWAVKMRITDPEVWKGVKEGKFKGFSLEGNFIDKEDYEGLQKDKELIESIMSILEK